MPAVPAGVRGVPAGSYTRSEANKEYAIAAAEALAADGALTSDAGQLWERVMAGAEKRHNGQMDVVMALWQEKLLAVG